MVEADPGILKKNYKYDLKVDVSDMNLELASELKILEPYGKFVLRLDRRLAPVKVAVLPLSKKDTLLPTAETIAADLRKLWNVDYDTAGAIGRRYRRQDEIGTPFCVTVDFDSLEDRSVTVRERDTMAQERVAIGELPAYLNARLVGC